MWNKEYIEHDQQNTIKFEIGEYFLIAGIAYAILIQFAYTSIINYNYEKYEERSANSSYGIRIVAAAIVLIFGEQNFSNISIINFREYYYILLQS